MPLDPDFLALLRCPASGAPLVDEGDALVSTDAATRLRFAVIDDIPDLLPEEATTLEEDAWLAVMKKHDTLPGGGGSGDG